MSIARGTGVIGALSLLAACGDGGGGVSIDATAGGADALADAAATSAEVAGSADTSAEVRAVEYVILPAAARIPLGRAVQYEAYASDGDRGNPVTLVGAWTIDPSELGMIAAPSLDRGAVFTAAKLGRARIAVTLPTGARADTTAEVVEDPITAIAVTAPDQRSVVRGARLAYQARASYQSGMVVDVTAQAIWRAADAKVATISNRLGERGTATATGPGATTIVAAFAGTEGTATLAVDDSPVPLQVVVSPAAARAGVLQAFKFSAELVYPAGTRQDVTGTAVWSSSDTTVAAVAPTGRGACNAGGMVTISATFMGATGTAKLTCEDAGPAVNGLQISPADHRAKVGDVIEYEVVATFSDGTSRDVSVETDFSSSVREVATFGTSAATARGPGQTTITARYRAVTTTTNLFVTAP